MIRKALSHHLLEAGHTISVAANGQEALRVIEGNRGIDLILCDVMMPELTGPSLILMLKKYYPKELPSVIIISGRKIDESFLKKIEIPYDHFIQKPIDFARISQLVGQLETARS